MSRSKRALFYRNDQASIDRDRAYRRSFGNVYDDYYYNYFYPYDFYPYDFYPYDFYPYDFYPYDFYPYDYYGFVNPLAAKQQSKENAVEKASNLQMRIRNLNLDTANPIANPLDTPKLEEPTQSTKKQGFGNFQRQLDKDTLKQKLQSIAKDRNNENPSTSISNKPEPKEAASPEGRKSQGKFNFKTNRNEARKKNQNQNTDTLAPQSPRSQSKPRQGGIPGVQDRRRQNDFFPNSNRFANRHVQE